MEINNKRIDTFIKDLQNSTPYEFLNIMSTMLKVYSTKLSNKNETTLPPA